MDSNDTTTAKEEQVLSEKLREEINQLVIVNKRWSWLSLMFHTLFYPRFNMGMLENDGTATKVYFRPRCHGSLKNFLHWCKARFNGLSYLQTEDTLYIRIVAVYNGTVRMYGTDRDPWHEIYRAYSIREYAHFEAVRAMGYMAVVHCYAACHPVDKNAHPSTTKTPKLVELFQWALNSIEQSVTMGTYGLDGEEGTCTIEWDLEELLQRFVEKKLHMRHKIYL